MGTSAEKLVKHTVKTISKTFKIDYSELKEVTKKISKLARNYDEQLLGMMEELMDLSNVTSEKELADFDINTLLVYCRIKEIECDSSSERNIRKTVWEHIEEELDDDFEPDSDESGDSESESGDSEYSESETEIEVVPEPEPKKEKKKKKVVIINETPETE